MPQPKDKDWLNGYKNKTLIYVVYKRPLKGELPWILPPFSQCPGCFLTGGKPVKLSLEPNSSLSVNVGSVN